MVERYLPSLPQQVRPHKWQTSSMSHCFIERVNPPCMGSPLPYNSSIFPLKLLLTSLLYTVVLVLYFPIVCVYVILLSQSQSDWEHASSVREKWLCLGAVRRYNREGKGEIFCTRINYHSLISWWCRGFEVIRVTSNHAFMLHKVM